MNFKAFVDTLPLMGYGMLGIFIVMLVIFGLIYALNHLTRTNIVAIGACCKRQIYALNHLTRTNIIAIGACCKKLIYALNHLTRGRNKGDGKQ